MTQETDFLDLYRQLGLAPGCDLAELKQAYRRRVATLHPDRQPERATDANASARLQRLIAQYGAAMDFHRRHGRLPGAPTVRAAPVGASNDGTPAAADPFAVFQAGARPSEAAFHVVRHDDRRNRHSRGRLATLLVVAALGVLAWSTYSISNRTVSGSSSEEAAQRIDAATVARDGTAEAPTLRLGMSPDEVRAIEGDPVSAHGDLWEYGPSWVRFDHDEVVDWHSSPLRALHTGENPAQVTGR